MSFSAQVDVIMDFWPTENYTYAANGTPPAGTPPTQTEDVNEPAVQGTFTYQM